MSRPLAFVLATLMASSALAYVRSSDDVTGACFYWTTRDPHWTLNEKGSDDLPFADVEAAAQKSLQTWQDVGCSDMAFTYDGPTARSDAGFDPDATNNINLIVWRETDCDSVVPPSDPCRSDDEHPFACANEYGCWLHSPEAIALTTVNFNRNTGVIVDADIELNGTPESGFVFTTVDGPPCAQAHDPDCTSTDVQNTLTHEAGHFIGLDHPLPSSSVCSHADPDLDDTMCGSAPIGETAKRTLEADDVAGLCAIYPAGKPPTTCTRSGSIVIAPVPNEGCGCGSTDLAGLGALLVGLEILRARARRRTT